MHIAPLPRIVIDNPSLDGQNGSNRAPLNPSEPVVNTDIEAAFVFLKTHSATPTTQRNYTKEIERLILWSIHEKNKAMSSLTFTDIAEFMEFLANPEPIATWSTVRKYPRESENWRPFTMKIVKPKKEGEKTQKIAGLAPSSRLTAMASLESFFTWLIDYGYLIKNPMRQNKALRKSIRAEQPKDEDAKIERYLDEEMWEAFLQAIELKPKETKLDLDSYERNKFIAALVIHLAPRASEIINGRMCDFYSVGKLWWWRVVGKGSKAAKIPVVKDMKKALIHYRTYLGLSPLPLSTDYKPLVQSLVDGNAISTRQLNFILDDLFCSASTLLEEKAMGFAKDKPEHAEFLTRAVKIKAASAHWMRHTSITYQIRSGVAKDVVQRNARHASSDTTASYTHEDEERWQRESEKMHST